MNGNACLRQSLFIASPMFCIGLIIVSFTLVIWPSSAVAAERIDPYACAWFAGQVASDDMDAAIEERLANPPRPDSAEYPYRDCVLAELMKRTGDSRAAVYYEQAIDAHPEEPGLELIYGDYLLWLRGVRNGLVVEAKDRYQQATKKIADLRAQDRWGARNDSRTEDDLKKSLFYLNRPNGMTLSRTAHDAVTFFSTSNEIRNDTVSFDYQWIDSRAFTSEALYAQSDIKLRRELTDAELRTIARNKFGVVSANRLRFQLGQLRAIDLTYRYLQFNNAKIANFAEPTQFSQDVGHELGGALSQDFLLPMGFDLFVKGSAKWIRRTTSAELQGADKENSQEYAAVLGLSRLVGEGKALGELYYAHQRWDPGYNWDSINTYSGRLLYQSRVFGLNRWILQGEYVFQDVNPSRFNPANDDMSAIIAQATYVFDVPDMLYGENIQEGEVFGGYIESVTLVASQNEVKKEEYYGGFRLRRLELSPTLNPFDIQFRSSFFKSTVKEDPTQTHRQWRNHLTVGYRLIEQPEVQWLPEGLDAIQPARVNLEVPLRHDGAVEGPRAFANYRVGLQVKGDFIYVGTAVPTPFYVTLGYAFQRLYHLGQNFHIALFRIGTGF